MSEWLRLIPLEVAWAVHPCFGYDDGQEGANGDGDVDVRKVRLQYSVVYLDQQVLV